MLDCDVRRVWLLMILACSGASPDEAARASAEAPEVVAAPATASGPSNPGQQAGTFIAFVDPMTGQGLQEVRDADREIVRFDGPSQSMIWAASGNAVGGWSSTGNDLRWLRSGVAFRVRFGSEGGERRAYFTEADRGTLCDLSISAPEQLSIRPTSETPPGD